MALIEDIFKGNAVTGVAGGVAALVLGPTVFSNGRADVAPRRQDGNQRRHHALSRNRYSDW
jgi:hypothetical protein